MDKIYAEAFSVLMKLEKNQGNNINKGAKLIVNAMKMGGILQGFGSGYYFSGARELIHRVGGLMPTKLISDPSYGKLESVVGVGTKIMNSVDIRKEDVLLITSHSGLVPIIIEVAMVAKSKGVPIIAVTSLSGAEHFDSLHPSGYKLSDLADVVIDTEFPFDKKLFNAKGNDTEVVNMSYYATIVVLQEMAFRAISELSKIGLDNLIIGSTGSRLDPLISQEAKDMYKNYKFRIQRF